MKKIILCLLIISMIIVLGVGLTACNNATPQGQLSNLLNTHSHEVFEYEVAKFDPKTNTYAQERGTYTAKLDAYKKGASVSFGTRTLENVEEGICVTGVLIYGDTVYNMGCYYTIVNGTSYMVPAYSFRTVTENEVKTFEMQGSYNGSTFECERIIGEDKYNNSVKLSGTIFDNNQFQQVLRSIPSATFSSGPNLSFSTPIASADEFTSAQLTARGGTSELIKTPYTNGVEGLKESGINCYKISLGRSTEVDGMSHTLYYATDNDANKITYNGWDMKNVLVRIIEPYTDKNKNSFEMHYNLVRASLS